MFVSQSDESATGKFTTLLTLSKSSFFYSGRAHVISKHQAEPRSQG